MKNSTIGIGDAEAEVTDLRVAQRKLKTQSRFLALSYGSLAILGLAGLLFDRSPATWLSILLPLAVAAGEGILGGRLADSPDPRRLRNMLGFEAFLFLAVVGMLLWLWQYPIAAQLNELGPDLLRMLEELTASIGTTPQAYLSFVWKGTLLILGALFALKVLVVAWRYRRWGRRAIVAKAASLPSP
jgi:hypothetical protein